jgi:hypothetical protein
MLTLQVDGNPEDSEIADNVYSCTGFVICYAGCPMFWQSKLQTEIDLSTAMAEYITLSQALSKTLPMTNLMREMNVIFCFVFSNTKICSQGLAGQSVLNCHDKQSKVYIPNKTYCH